MHKVELSLTIKKILKGNKYIYPLLKFVRKIQKIILPNFIFNVNKILRVNGIYRNSQYEKLKTLKDKHKGERCFIVGTGPSLIIQDLDKLRNEVTFSMNSIFFAFDETEWRPNYYGVQFPDFYSKYKSEIDHLDVEYKFVGDVISKQNKLSNEYYIYPLNLLNHTWHHQKYHTKFSEDAFAVIYDGYTITYSLLQLAVYLGFVEIYLIGVDCNYSSNTNNHFKDYGVVDPLAFAAGEKMISAFKEAKKYADRHGIKIYNATRGGMLEIFERVDLDNVFSEENVV